MSLPIAITNYATVRQRSSDNLKYYEETLKTKPYLVKKYFIIALGKIP